MLKSIEDLENIKNESLKSISLNENIDVIYDKFKKDLSDINGYLKNDKISTILEQLTKSETTVDILPLIYCKNCDKSKLTKKIIDSSNLIYWYITDINDKLVTDIDSLVTSSSPKELSTLKKISFDKIKVKDTYLGWKYFVYK